MSILKKPTTLVYAMVEMNLQILGCLSPNSGFHYSRLTPQPMGLVVFDLCATCLPRVHHVFTTCRTWSGGPSNREGTLTLPGEEQQNTAEKKNRLKLAPSRCHVMNSRILLRRPTGFKLAFFVPWHEQQSTAEKPKRCPSWHPHVAMI